MTSAKKEYRRHPSDGGPVLLVARAEKYVMARRPGCMPFVVSERRWESWELTEPTNKAKDKG